MEIVTKAINPGVLAAWIRILISFYGLCPLHDHLDRTCPADVETTS